MLRGHTSTPTVALATLVEGPEALGCPGCETSDPVHHKADNVNLKLPKTFQLLILEAPDEIGTVRWVIHINRELGQLIRIAPAILCLHAHNRLWMI